MTTPQLCDYCHEELPAEPIRRGERVYCCEACAYEASRSHDCGGRTDSTYTEPKIEMPTNPPTTQPTN